MGPSTLHCTGPGGGTGTRPVNEIDQSECSIWNASKLHVHVCFSIKKSRTKQHTDSSRSELSLVEDGPWSVTVACAPCVECSVASARAVSLAIIIYRFSLQNTSLPLFFATPGAGQNSHLSRWLAAVSPRRGPSSPAGGLALWHLWHRAPAQRFSGTANQLQRRESRF